MSVHAIDVRILQLLSPPGFFGAAETSVRLKIDYATHRIEANKEWCRMMIVCHDFSASCNIYKHRTRQLYSVEFFRSSRAEILMHNFSS